MFCHIRASRFIYSHGSYSYTYTIVATSYKNQHNTGPENGPFFNFVESYLMIHLDYQYKNILANTELNFNKETLFQLTENKFSILKSRYIPFYERV